jgi:3'(2'), 5'-bisphosphate nucleotidase
VGQRGAELEAAVEAVRAASHVCHAVQKRLVDEHRLEKKDRSPVTVADFASQAIVCRSLGQAFPGDPVVGEEDAHELRRDENAGIRATVVQEVARAIASEVGADEVLDWIDHGGDEATGDRYWTLDPIDGTKGFLRGEQYAVALGLIENGEVVLGVLGCPNLPDSDGERGVLFAAERGDVARMRPLFRDGEAVRVGVEHIGSAAEARFCESVESGHSDQDESAKIAKLLGIRSEPYRIDSQCKYAAVARGDASIYLRMPTRKDYREKIWDHAAGKLVVEAAGGRVTDIHGQTLDFGRGRTLAANSGVVATSGTIHDEVIDAIRRVRAG